MYDTTLFPLRRAV